MRQNDSLMTVEDPILEAVLQASEKLNRAAMLLRRGVSGTEFQSPASAILELFVDLGELLSQGDVYNLERDNPEIFEDPLDRSDVLGNVRMIHKRASQVTLFSPQLESFGEQVAERASKFLMHLSAYKVGQSETEDLDYQLDDYDLVAADSGRSAKKRIVGLKREVVKLLRANRKAHRLLKSTQKALERKKLLIESLQTRLNALSERRSSS